VITVVDYDRAWPGRFEKLRAEYTAAMAAAGVPVVAIEHVGASHDELARQLGPVLRP